MAQALASHQKSRLGDGDADTEADRMVGSVSYSHPGWQADGRRQTGAGRQGQADGQADTQTDTEDGHAGKTYRQAGTHTDDQTDRQTGKQADRHADTEADRQTGM